MRKITRSAGIVLSCVALAAAIALTNGRAFADATSRLQSTVDDVAKKWPNITHIAPLHASKIIAEGLATVFDVRTEEEFAVSHVPGAIRVDPAMTREAFLSQHGAALKGKTAVFYCAVGVRSSNLAQRVGADALTAAGANRSVNVAGGIFAWHGEALPLENANGKTDLVHGYDSSWGKLIKRQELIATEPPK
jgi:rhodanese-related sulfurtransferase